jgi:hypothetical protein
VGAATAAMAVLIGRELFSPRVGLLAGVLTAFYPYYVLHDTGPQETSLQTVLTCGAVFLAIKALRRPSFGWAVATGGALGAVVLTRSTVAPFAILVPVWLLAFGKASPVVRMRTAVVISMVFLLALAPWLIRSNRVVGRPTLSTETGERLWAGNNPYTFTHYPIESIDRSTAAAWEALSPADLDQLRGLKPSDLAFDQFFKGAALRFMSAHPGLTAWRMTRKVAIAFSVLPSPRHGFMGNLVYAASFGPIMCLGLMGMIRTRREWREHGVISLLFLSFIAVTAVFYAQTSHRSFLDVYWIVFAASVLVAVFPAAAPRGR